MTENSIMHDWKNYKCTWCTWNIIHSLALTFNLNARLSDNKNTIILKQNTSTIRIISINSKGAFSSPTLLFSLIIGSVSVSVAAHKSSNINSYCANGADGAPWRRITDAIKEQKRSRIMKQHTLQIIKGFMYGLSPCYL